MTSFGRKWLKRLLLGSSAAFFLLIIAATVIWFSPTIRSKLQSAALHFALAKAKPHLPFTIESIEVHATWNEFFKGEISDIGTHLLWGRTEIQLSGPISWKRNAAAHIFAVSFTPQAEVISPMGKTPLLPLVIDARIKDNLLEFEEVHFSTETEKFNWAASHLELEKLKVHASWLSKSARAEAAVSVASLAYAQKSPDHEIHLRELSLKAESDLGFKPFHYGPQIKFSMNAKDGEALWGDRYVSLPLKDLPLEGEFTVPDKNSQDIQGRITVGSSLTLQASAERVDKEISSAKIKWSTAALDLYKLIAGAASALQNDQLAEIEFKSGSLQTSGTAQIPFKTHTDPLIHANIKLAQVSFEWPTKYLAVDRLNLDLPISNEGSSQGSMSAGEILYRKMTAELKPSEIHIASEDSSHRHFKFFLGKDKNLPLVIHEFPFHIGALNGEMHLPDADENRFHYTLQTNARLPSTGADKIIPPLCLKLGKLPAATLQADFSNIDISSDQIEPDGQIDAHFFDGTLTLKKIGFYNLREDVRETDFDLDLENVRLDLVGEFLNFGTMDGYLHAYAHNVTLQSALPTHYDFKLEVLPHDKQYVQFSTDAMKNVLGLVGASQALTQGGIMGSLTNWVGFGGFRDFFGGYDILFAGLSLFSDGGKIMMETLQPPDTASAAQKQTFVTKHKNDHYILYGPANWLTGEPFFKILLHGSSYPYILDATAMSNFVYRKLKPKLDQAAKLKAMEKKGNAKNPKVSEIHDDLSCDPPRLPAAHLLRHR